MTTLDAVRSESSPAHSTPVARLSTSPVIALSPLASRGTLLRRIGVAAALLATAVLVWETMLEDRLFAKRWGVVVPGQLYRSGQVSRFLIDDVLREHRVATVIDLNGFNRFNADQQVELAVAEYLEIDHHRFALAGDGQGDVEKYADAVALIACRAREGKPVLVHCGAGSHRTGGVVAVYRLLVLGDPPERVMRELEAYGASRSRNRKLYAFLNANLGRLAELLAERGVLQRVPDELPRLD